MTKIHEGLNQNITLNDVQLATVYYPILIDLAKHKHCLTYGELVERAKEENPKNKIVKNAIAVSTGRKLDVVRIFTKGRGLPDVTSLIINKSEGECGVGFTDHFNPEKARLEVYQKNWSEVTIDFDLYIDVATKNAIPIKRRKRDEALNVLSEHYMNNKNLYSSKIKDYREDILILLMEGFDVKESFGDIVKKYIEV